MTVQDLRRTYRPWSLTIGGGLAALGLVLGLIGAAMDGEVGRGRFHIVDLIVRGLIVSWLVGAELQI